MHKQSEQNTRWQNLFASFVFVDPHNFHNSIDRDGSSFILFYFFIKSKIFMQNRWTDWLMKYPNALKVPKIFNRISSYFRWLDDVRFCFVSFCFVFFFRRWFRFSQMRVAFVEFANVCAHHTHHLLWLLLCSGDFNLQISFVFINMKESLIKSMRTTTPEDK